MYFSFTQPVAFVSALMLAVLSPSRDLSSITLAAFLLLPSVCAVLCVVVVAYLATFFLVLFNSLLFLLFVVYNYTLKVAEGKASQPAIQIVISPPSLLLLLLLPFSALYVYSIDSDTIQFELYTAQHTHTGTHSDWMGSTHNTAAQGPFRRHASGVSPRLEAYIIPFHDGNQWQRERCIRKTLSGSASPRSPSISYIYSYIGLCGAI